MNHLERQMLDILKRGRDEFGYAAVKAEFEAEGTRTDELLRLMEIARKADLELGLKIGGCEAMRDLMEAKQIGVEYVIAPMIESPYALSKYIDAKNIVYTEDEQQDTKFLFNLETETAFQHLPELVDDGPSRRAGPTASSSAGSTSPCRPDATGTTSTPMPSPSTASRPPRSSRTRGMTSWSGGGVSMDALDALRRIRSVYLSRFETRKVIFDAASLEGTNLEKGLVEAVHFELLWLLNKREYYGAIQHEDAKRIEMLEKRWHVLAADDRA